MKAFIYNGKTYLRCIPGKSLFHSTLVHEVVNRGDIFGLDIETQVFTIIKGTAAVEHIELNVYTPAPGIERMRIDSAGITHLTDGVQVRAIRKLRKVRDLLNAGVDFTKASSVVEAAQKELAL